MPLSAFSYAVSHELDVQQTCDLFRLPRSGQVGSSWTLPSDVRGRL